MKSARALARLASPGAVLARERTGAGYGVFPQGDRRRRPVARLSATEVRALEADGAIEQAGDAFILSEAGRARAAREAADPASAFLVQHAPLEARTLVDADGDARVHQGVQRSVVLQRLAALRDGKGAPWLSGVELSAAQTLRTDWEVSQRGLTRGSDWRAPPIGSSARGASNAQERAMAMRCDARRRVAEALEALAQPLRRVVERACLHEDGLEALERSEGWPARSGKLALKLGLAQLAQALAQR